MKETKFMTWQIVKLKTTKKKQVKLVKVVNYNINAANCNVLTLMQYVHCLRNINNQSTAIRRQIIPVDIEVEYFCDNIIYHHQTSVCIFLYIQCKKSGMKLVWKYGRLSFILFLKSSIPFHSGIFHIPYRNFRSIPFYFLIHSIPYHTMPWLSMLLLQHFITSVVAWLKIRKRLILKKLLPLPAPFQHFRFRVRFHFNLFHQSASASTKN